MVLTVDGREHRVRMSDGESRYDPADSPTSVGYVDSARLRLAGAEDPLVLESGARLGPADLEYETYGELDAAGSNAVLICHALTGDAHVAGWDRDHSATGRFWRRRRPGWWDRMVGPGKAIDTRRFFVVCANNLGSCYGSTSPSSPDPTSDRPYGLGFPMVTVHDWVVSQARLLDHLGIERLHAVIGGSLGGQQAIEWACAFPERVANCVVLAASARLSTQGLAFNAVGRAAIMHDPRFASGDYYGRAESPDDGLAVARMLAHITYLSDAAMLERFGRRRRDRDAPEFGFGTEFEVESYLDHQGRSFVERFDANSYLYMTRAMDYYDAAAAWGDGDLDAACARIVSRTMVVSFSSDWLYPSEECKELALAIRRAGRPVTYVDVPSRYGHDAFLVQTDEVGRLVRPFLKRGGDR